MGALFPAAGVTVTKICVVVVGAMLAAAIVAVRVVGMATLAVVVTVVEPEDPAKAVFPAYVAVMVLAPELRLLALIVMTAFAVEPEALRVAVPSGFWPRVNAMLPVGGVTPDAGVSVTETCVV